MVFDDDKRNISLVISFVTKTSVTVTHVMMTAFKFTTMTP
jgi:hypothetical protein